MLIFIDESGIHKNIGFLTFVLAYIEVDDYVSMEKQICEIEKKLGLEYFHWSETAR